jgi:hypothetical protein
MSIREKYNIDPDEDYVVFEFAICMRGTNIEIGEIKKINKFFSYLMKKGWLRKVYKEVSKKELL